MAKLTVFRALANDKPWLPRQVLRRFRYVATLVFVSRYSELAVPSDRLHSPNSGRSQATANGQKADRRHAAHDFVSRVDYIE